MSTSWSEMILRFLDDGYTRDEVINYFNHPAINDEYIDTALDSRKRLLKKRCDEHTKPRKTVPVEGSKLRLIYDFAMLHGGIPAYAELLKTRTQVSIAKELGIPVHIALNFKRDFIMGRKPRFYLNNAPNLTMKIRADQIYAGTYKKKRKRLSLKEVRNLW